MVRMILISTMEVIGINTLLCSLSIRISPGSLPNQRKTPGAKYRISPTITKIIPAIINQRAIIPAFLFMTGSKINISIKKIKYWQALLS